ncbi:hypothetical protein A2635_01790 [Candidatus Peribacteria bacterium RIFCSPHIGHO2_01_FULL_51_9]|nr:MAG: hypothetical protein A2635_01790 [Candidatus Peribacteria bacterium RIFCSPHIGHO2_01_FULL_51_9]
MKFVRGLSQSVIILFCLWHMAAIFVYSIPNETKMKQMLRSAEFFSRPYILLTSQWQLWNLFSPDPLRRVSEYQIEIFEQNRWNSLTTLRPGSFPWWKHAAQFKLIDRILESEQNLIPLQERYLSHLCRTYNIPPQTLIRFTYTYYVIPNTRDILDTAWWKSWSPSWESIGGITIVCPPPIPA